MLGFDFFPLCMEYKSEGEKPFPDENFLSGCHSFPITAGKWNHVIWEIPVGMHSFGDTDIPYMPMTNQATYFEVWVHPASRMLWTLADLF